MHLPHPSHCHIFTSSSHRDTRTESLRACWLNRPQRAFQPRGLCVTLSFFLSPPFFLKRGLTDAETPLSAGGGQLRSAVKARKMMHYPAARRSPLSHQHLHCTGAAKHQFSRLQNVVNRATADDGDTTKWAPLSRPPHHAKFHSSEI